MIPIFVFPVLPVVPWGTVLVPVLMLLLIEYHLSEVLWWSLPSIDFPSLSLGSFESLLLSLSELILACLKGTHVWSEP